MALTAHKLRLISLLHETGALQFGSFTLKSGRVSPYFFNARKFDTGPWLAELGRHYARAIRSTAPRATIVFGPAYAGIALAVASAMALSKDPSKKNRTAGFLFNRKEEKTHGDRGMFVGHTPGARDRIVLVDDVITDGGTKREAVALLQQAFPGTPLEALVIAFDRQERDVEGENALQRFSESTGLPVVALLTLEDLIQALTGPAQKKAATASRGMPKLSRAQRDALLDYRTQYGLSAPSSSRKG
jgi:orotate phosphoribosyltransferase